MSTCLIISGVVVLAVAAVVLARRELRRRANRPDVGEDTMQMLKAVPYGSVADEAERILRGEVSGDG